MIFFHPKSNFIHFFAHNLYVLYFFLYSKVFYVTMSQNKMKIKIDSAFFQTNSAFFPKINDFFHNFIFFFPQKNRIL